MIGTTLQSLRDLLYQLGLSLGNPPSGSPSETLAMQRMATVLERTAYRTAAGQFFAAKARVTRALDAIREDAGRLSDAAFGDANLESILSRYLDGVREAAGQARVEAEGNPGTHIFERLQRRRAEAIPFDDPDLLLAAADEIARQSIAVASAMELMQVALPYLAMTAAEEGGRPDGVAAMRDLELIKAFMAESGGL